MDNSEDDDDLSFSMADAEDHAILMHRDSHFSGSFATMIEYYEQGGKGAMQEFELSRIRDLAELERRSGKDLAGMLLTGGEAEKVAAARATYKALREIYETPNPKNLAPRLIADLILSEEEVPELEIEAIIAQKEAIVPELIQLLRSEDFHSSLFPGYGQAPILAAHCLGLIGDKRAMFSLFEAIGEESVFAEDFVLEALQKMGPTAKEFLLKVLKSEPLNFDNERAAIALAHFNNDPEVASACLEMLLKPHVWKDQALTLHLILACEWLRSQEEQDQFKALALDPKFPKMLIQDINLIAKVHKQKEV